MKSMSLILFCLLCGASSTSSQTQSKLIEWQPKPMGSNNERWTDGTQLFRVLDQVQIESVAVEEPITIGQSFTADDDWLKSIVFRVRNLSGQQLAAIQLTLILPQMDQASPDVIYCYGCAPEEKAKGIAPGETVEVKILRDEYYDFVKSRAVDKGGISQISRAQIREMFVTLRDGTRWVSGCIKTADAKNACRPTAQ